MSLDNTPCVSGSSLVAICDWLELEGLDVDGVCLGLGIDREALSRADNRCPLIHLNALLTCASEALGDPGLGLRLGASTDTRKMGVLGHIVFNNRTLQQGLEQFERLASLSNEGIRIRFDPGGEAARLSYLCEQPDHYAAINLERMLAQAVTRARVFVSKKVVLSEVGFAHEATTELARYEEILGCRPRFAQPHCYLCFDPSYLDFELPERNPYLHQALSRHVEDLLMKLPGRRLSQRVSKVIERGLSKGVPEASTVADQLAMSRQTLYRRLKQEGISYQELVEQVRRSKAEAYLKAGRYTLAEIAFLLGFSEQSAFSRAFKRWTGKSPAQYRRD